MKFSLATIALAATVVASPTGGNPPPSGVACPRNGNNDGKTMCCNSAIPILGELFCNVLVFGPTCKTDQSSYCCNSNAQGGLINLALFNCAQILS